jgi:hypothetical protein
VGLLLKSLETSVTLKTERSLFMLMWLVQMMGFFSVAGFFRSVLPDHAGSRDRGFGKARDLSNLYGFFRNREGF